uniref:Uncharacterized protein n=1 Tax=viral metagenome TaxID=1070528 RepID=A0A6C0KFI4_9ZZZZ
MASLSLEETNDYMNDYMNEYMNDYMKSLSEDELKALAIAQDHLKTSFDMVKSIHYQKWLQKRNQININKK